MKKYRIINNNLFGGTVPKINPTKSTVVKDLSDKNNKIEFMNISGPLYFNLERNPIVQDQDNISFYEYNYTYPQDNLTYLIDNNLNLNKRPKLISEYEKQQKKKKFEQSKKRTRHQIITTIDSVFKDNNRVIQINGQDIPYYLGKFHNDKKLFGRLKLLFQLYVKKDFNSENYVEYKQENKVLDLINSLFIIAQDEQRNYELININKKLENPIDKYIFISKFYELLEILTWECPITSIESMSSILFINISVELRTKKNSELQNIIQKEDFSGLIRYYNNSSNGYEVKFFKKFIDEDTFLSPIEKIQYIKMLCIIDHTISKLNFLFTLDTESNPDKINLANLQDLYQTYKTIFTNEINTSFSDNLKICKNIEAINKTNMKNTQDKNLKELILNETSELVNFHKTLQSIKDPGLSIDIQDLNLDMILVLSYFDLRMQNYQINIGKYLDALPLNRTKIFTNLFGNGRSYESTNSIIINTEKFLNKYGFGPKIIQVSPVVNFPDLNIDFSACVEHSILQFLKFLFWDDDKKKYDINYLELPHDNFLRKFMQEFIKTQNESDEIIRMFIRPLINLKHIDYVSPKSEKKYYELNATPDNFVRIVLLLLRTSETDIMSKPHVSKDTLESNIQKINKIIGKINYKINISSTSEIFADVNLFKIIEEQDILVLKVNLAQGAHGGASKPSFVDPEQINPNIKNFVSYLLLKSNIEGYEIYTGKYFPTLISQDIYKSTGNIVSKYFNSDNIYWINFIDFIDLYYKNSFEPDEQSEFNLKFVDVISQIVLTPNNKNITIINSSLKYVLDYIILLSLIKIEDKPEFYEKIIKYLLSKTNILDYEFDYRSKKYNIFQHYIDFYIGNYNLDSLILFANTFSQINNSKLYDYTDINNRPINIFITNYTYDFNHIYGVGEESIIQVYNKINKIIESLIDEEEKVLFEAIGDNQKLPLYIYVSNFKNLINTIKYKRFSDDVDKEIIIETILVKFFNTLIDKNKYVLELTSSPLVYFVDKNFSGQTDLDIDKKYIDYLIKIPINFLQTKTNIIFNYVVSEKTIETSVIYYAFNNMIKYQSITNFNNLFIQNLNYFIQNKLLIDSDIQGNQSVLNYKLDGFNSLLGYYVEMFSESNFVPEVFMQLYNKSLLVLNPALIFSYFNNPNTWVNINSRLNINEDIIKLLIKDYEGESPLSLQLNDCYPIKYFLIKLNKIKESKLEIVSNFLSSDNSYQIINLLSKDKNHLQNSKDIYLEICSFVKENNYPIDEINFRRILEIF